MYVENQVYQIIKWIISIDLNYISYFNEYKNPIGFSFEKKFENSKKISKANKRACIFWKKNWFMIHHI